jgi:hypothetical protein
MLHKFMVNVEPFQFSLKLNKNDRQCACLRASPICPSSRAHKKSLDSVPAALSCSGKNLDWSCSVRG